MSLATFPGHWKTALIGDIFNVQQGKALSAKSRQGLSPLPFLRTANVLWGQLDLSSVDQMDFTPPEVGKLRLQPNDLLICEGGEIGRAAVWRGELALCLHQNHVYRLRAKDASVVYTDFYMFWLQAAFLLLGLYAGQGNKTTIANLPGTRLKAFAVPVPPLPEQRAIAHALRTIREAKEARRRELALERERKAALMQHLFTHGTRGEPTKQAEVGEMPESWQVVRLGEVLNVVQGQVDPKVLPYSRMPHVGPENIEANTGRLLPTRTAEQLRLISGKYCFTPEHVLYSKIRPYLKKAGLPTYQGICSADMYPLRPHADKLTREFLFHFLLTEDFTQQAVSFQSRTGIPKINREQLSSILMPLPSFQEQGDITNVLSACDTKTTSLNQEATLLEELFRAMLEELMSGRLSALPLGGENALASD